MKIYAGFDCGGSNTRCMLTDENGDLLGIGKGGASNYLFIGKEVAAKSILDSIAMAFADAGIEKQPIAGMFIASAAVEVFHGKEHEAFFREVTGCEEVSCDSDIFPVWFAGSRFAPAIAMIAGTGAVTYLLRDETFIKASGWGPLFGDEASGYDIGVKALRITARMADGRMEKDEMFYNAMLAHYGVDLAAPRKLLPAVNGADFRKKAASAAAVADRLYREGNPIAVKLFEDAAEECLCCVKAVLRQTELEKLSLILSGGLFREDSPLYALLGPKAEALPQIERVMLPKVSAVCSSAAIALHRAGRKQAAEHLMKEGCL